MRSDQHAALGVVEQQQEETHAVARREGEIVGRMVACVGEFYAKVLVEGGVGDFGDVVQRDGGAGIVGYVVIHSDAIRSISSRKNAGCQSPSPMAAASSDRRRPRQCAVGRRGVQFVLPGLVAEAQQARAEEVDDQAQQQHDARDEPPAAVGDGLLEDHQLGEEQRRGREGHQHNHPREQSHGPHAVDVDVVADAG